MKRTRHVEVALVYNCTMHHRAIECDGISSDDRYPGVSMDKLGIMVGVEKDEGIIVLDHFAFHFFCHVAVFMRGRSLEESLCHDGDTAVVMHRVYRKGCIAWETANNVLIEPGLTKEFAVTVTVHVSIRESSNLVDGKEASLHFKQRSLDRQGVFVVVAAAAMMVARAWENFMCCFVVGGNLVVNFMTVY